MKLDKLPPHVASKDHNKPGAHDVPVQMVSEASTKGRHSGRAHPKADKLGGYDFAAGASQGPTTTQNMGE